MSALSIYKTFDIIILPFPFTEINQSKKRPGLVISSYKNFGFKTGHSIIAMITSTHSSWPLDFKITDLKSSGLFNPSLIRMKLISIDNKLIHKKIGTLSKSDQAKFKENLKVLFEEIF